VTRVLVVTDAQDDTANAVVAALQRRGTPWARLNLAEFPELARITFDPLEPSGCEIKDSDGDHVTLDQITAAWIWHPQPFRPLPGLEAAEAAFVDEACRCAWRLLGEWLEDHVFVVNRPGAERRADDKGLQLRKAAAVGLAIPETLVTNDPDRARAFCSSHAETVFKLLNRPRIDYGDRAAWIGTRLLDSGDLDALDTLRHCPGIFQRRIPKRFDLRVTVVGDRLFPVEIHSQDDPRAMVDFRLALAEDPAALLHAVHDLPAEVAGRIRVLMRDLGLVFGALDLVVTPAGDYVFLEVNPSGQFGWIEGQTGQPISGELVGILERGRP